MELMLFGGLLLLLIATGLPIASSIGLTAIAVMAVRRGILALPYAVLAQRMMYGVNSFPILAIPLFLLAGKLMNTGGITERIFQFACQVAGWWPGGLGHVNVLASIIFAGMSGSAVADAAGLGTIEIKAMLDAGYDREFSAAITAASSVIGPIIPPSIPLVIFGVMGEVSIGALLIGGIIPGLMIGISLMLLIFWTARQKQYPVHPRPKVREAVRSFFDAFPTLLTPAILIGGIFSGIFTPTEAAAVCVLYALIISVFLYREISWTDLQHIMTETLRDSAMILFIIACAALYAWVLIRLRIPIILAERVFQISTNPLTILLILYLFFLVVGCFMVSLAAITILSPILVPLCSQVGIDPLHLGLVMVLNLMIGLLTPPVGMCLYAVCRVADISFEQMVKTTLPFYVPLLAVLMLITIFPGVVLFLPRLVFR